MTTITLDQAKAAANFLVKDAGADIIWPDNPIRQAVVFGLAAVNAIKGSGWNLAVAQQYVSVTLPGVGAAQSLLGQVPYIGGLLVSLTSSLVHPTIFLSPAAASDPIQLLATIMHELGHVGQIRKGGPLWCLDYGVTGEVRAIAEAPCYATTMDILVYIGGVNPNDAEGVVLSALQSYGITGPDMDLAHAIILSNTESLLAGADPGEAALTVKSALIATGWTP